VYRRDRRRKRKRREGSKRTPAGVFANIARSAAQLNSEETKKVKLYVEMRMSVSFAPESRSVVEMRRRKRIDLGARSCRDGTRRTEYHFVSLLVDEK
jgi:hypothetical protein